MSETNDRELTDQQEIFCQFYTTYWNATKAAKDAKYSEKSASVLGYQLLQNPLVQKRIAQLTDHALKEIGVTRERVLTELARIAFSDLRVAYNEVGALLRPDELPDDFAPAIAGIEVDEIWEGHGDEREQIGETKKLKLWDKTKALDSLAKHLSLTPERHEHSGPNGKPIETSNMTDEQLELAIAAMLAKAEKP